MANGHGGKRAGSGRKPGPRHETAIAEAKIRIAGRLPDLVDGLLAMADKGHYKATVYLVDRVMGKPTQPVNVGGQPGNPVQLRYVNDWRGSIGSISDLEGDSAPLSAPGAANGTDPVEAA